MPSSLALLLVLPLVQSPVQDTAARQADWAVAPVRTGSRAAWRKPAPPCSTECPTTVRPRLPINRMHPPPPGRGIRRLLLHPPGDPPVRQLCHPAVVRRGIHHWPQTVHRRSQCLPRPPPGTLCSGRWPRRSLGLNSVTGVWNLWESRHQPAGRTRRTLHGLLMLAADAGFGATASMPPTNETISTVPVPPPSCAGRRAPTRPSPSARWV